MFASLINPLAILLSLSTATGVLVHDTKIDRVAMAAVALPAVVVSYDGLNKVINFGDMHTHVERSSLGQVMNDFRAQDPLMKPRSSDDKKHLIQRHTGRGYYVFDSYNLPIA